MGQLRQCSAESQGEDVRAGQGRAGGSSARNALDVHERASVVPRPDPDIELHWRHRDGRRFAVAVNKRTGRYRRLGEGRALIWTLCDGTRTMAQVAAEVAGRGGPSDMALVVQIVSDLARTGLIRDFRDGQSGADPRSRWCSFLACGRILTAKMEWRGVDPLADWLYNRAAFLLSSSTMRWLCIVIQSLGAALFAVQVTARDTFTLATGQSTWLLPPCLLGCVVLHETAHAMAVKHSGRRVIGVGVGWFWIAPICYVNTSDMWLATRRQRILASLAGPMSDLLIAGLLAILAALGSGPLSGVALAASGILYLATVVNLSPLLEYDGYYVLTDLLERPHLRRQSIRWLLGEFRPMSSNWNDITSHKVELVYGLAALAYTALLMIVSAQASFSVLTTLLGHSRSALVRSLAWLVTLLLQLFLVSGLLGEMRQLLQRRPTLRRVGVTL